MNESQLKELDNSELIDELHRKRDILDLCVHGVLNADYAITPTGLLWVKEDMNHLTKELEKRLMNS